MKSHCPTSHRNLKLYVSGMEYVRRLEALKRYFKEDDLMYVMMIPVKTCWVIQMSRHCAEHFTSIKSYNPSITATQLPFYPGQGKRMIMFPKVTQLVSSWQWTQVWLQTVQCACCIFLWGRYSHAVWYLRSFHTEVGNEI